MIEIEMLVKCAQSLAALVRVITADRLLKLKAEESLR